MPNYRYLWYCVEIGISDDFSTEEECTKDAYAQHKQHPAEYSIYAYDANVFPNGNVTIDDCEYIGCVGAN